MMFFMMYGYCREKTCCVEVVALMLHRINIVDI